MPDQPSLTSTGPFGLTTSRVVALITPIAATLMGGISAWLFEHFPGLQTIVPEDTAASSLTTGAIWVVTALVTYAISHKWLDGLSKWERSVRPYAYELPPRAPVPPPPPDVAEEPASSALGMNQPE